jgi:hypothetical protein
VIARTSRSPPRLTRLRASPADDHHPHQTIRSGQPAASWSRLAGGRGPRQDRHTCAEPDPRPAFAYRQPHVLSPSLRRSRSGLSPDFSEPCRTEARGGSSARPDDADAQGAEAAAPPSRRRSPLIVCAAGHGVCRSGAAADLYARPGIRGPRRQRADDRPARRAGHRHGQDELGVTPDPRLGTRALPGRTHRAGPDVGSPDSKPWAARRRPRASSKPHFPGAPATGRDRYAAPARARTYARVYV